MRVKLLKCLVPSAGPRPPGARDQAEFAAHAAVLPNDNSFEHGEQGASAAG